MKIFKSLFFFAIALTITVACSEKKAVENQPKEAPKQEVKQETPKTEPAMIEVTEDSVTEAEKDRLDSIKQVKEHGHAH